jgi:hypothetical protein
MKGLALEDSKLLLFPVGTSLPLDCNVLGQSLTTPF